MLRGAGDDQSLPLSYLHLPTILSSAVGAHLETLYEHAGMLENRLASGGLDRYASTNALTAAVLKVENKAAQETHVVLLDVDGRTEERGE